MGVSMVLIQIVERRKIARASRTRGRHSPAHFWLQYFEGCRVQRTRSFGHHLISGPLTNAAQSVYGELKARIGVSGP